MFRQIFNSAYQSVYAVFSDTVLGTAFSVHRDGYLATARHVVSDLAGQQVAIMQTVGGRRQMAATIVRDDPATDLALLRLSERTGQVASLDLSPAPALYGQSVLVMGYPCTYRSVDSALQGRPMVNLRINGCTVASDISLPAFDETDSISVEAFEVDSNLHPGMSGAPVVDMSGRVVGIVSRGFWRQSAKPYLEESDYTVAVRAQHLVPLLSCL
jgi:putative serine protease PepD